MKHQFHFHFYSRIFIALAILALGIFFLQKKVDTQAFVLNNISIGGWAWSEYTGWVSLNCLNDYDGDGQLESRCDTTNFEDWGVRVEGGQLKGCGWSGNYRDPDSLLGWVCFSDQGAYTGAAPDNGVHIISDQQRLCYPGASGECNAANSFASIVEFEKTAKYVDVEAWKLGSVIGTDTVSASPIGGCFNCYEQEIKRCLVADTSCTTNLNCAHPDICVVKDYARNCGNCLQYNYYDTARCQIGGTICANDAECSALIPGDKCREGLLESVYGGYSCTNCTISNLDNTCDLNAGQANLNSCNSCSQIVATPGVMVDNRYNDAGLSRGFMCGWAWNAWDNPTGPTDYGIGWMQFSPRITTSTNPYFSVVGGNIYSRGNIYARFEPPVNRYNAFYLIESSGLITNFRLYSTFNNLYQGDLENRPYIDYFTSINSSRYRNVLGTLDVVGLTTEATSGSGINKYGSTIVTNPDLATELSEPLQGKVLRFTGGLTIEAGSNLQILAGSGSDIGSGIIIVEDGDLIFNDDISYQSGPYTRLRDIPSLVWIVNNADGDGNGDVKISGNVTEIAGTVIVLGDTNPSSTLDCSIGVPGASEDPDFGCGYFDSCYDSAQNCSQQLVINGSVIARAFVLSRSYTNTNGDPAEWVINSGHLQANPPRGLTDFSKAVPRFTDIAQ